MGSSTELRRVKRSFWKELNYRSNWFVFGIVGVVLLGMIPVLGWFMAIGLLALVLWKSFGFREVFIVGECPACTKSLNIDLKHDVISCSVCNSVMKVQDDHLRLVDLNRS